MPTNFMGFDIPFNEADELDMAKLAKKINKPRIDKNIILLFSLFS
jgi:hypothetical protein